MNAALCSTRHHAAGAVVKWLRTSLVPLAFLAVKLVRIAKVVSLISIIVLGVWVLCQPMKRISKIDSELSSVRASFEEVFVLYSSDQPEMDSVAVYCGWPIIWLDCEHVEMRPLVSDIVRYLNVLSQGA